MSKFTKKELMKSSARHQFGLQLGHNYARMQGLGYFYSIYPALKKIYADNPEALDKACRAHHMYYNTTPQMSEIILGMDIAIEEAEGIDAIDTVIGLKTGLMGPFAAFGDVIFSTIQQTIFGAIAANMAIQGNFTGMLIWMLWYIFVIFLRFYLFNIGYKQGSNLVSSMNGKLESITRGAGIVGLMVVGALISSTIKITIPITFTSGEVTFALQDALDSILLYLPQIGLTALIYWLSGKPKMTTTKLIFIVMISAIILAALHIIA